ncbi:hypothetical protein BC937DRAFT_91855 [Endogone sp. FLAS-F59071]|nr:hypothetical protein BC937DRAFT_91855 [Endogone sp. FLAS-F59071]|eukprot:RUS21687.1 hypothetical protein BC937DRAFT_91855 [Endogone sp. FLAS-F59071]
MYLLAPITDPNTEIVRWLEIISLKKDVYNRPFFLSPEIYKKAIAVLEADSDNNDTKDDFDFDTLKPSEVNESAFQKAIIKHLKENDVTDFPYSIIRSSPEMNRCAGKVLLYQYETATPDPQRVSGLFERTIHKLVKEGFLIVKDKDGDVYEVVDNKRNIGSAVLEVIREAEKGFDCEAVSIHIVASHSME